MELWITAACIGIALIAIAVAFAVKFADEYGKNAALRSQLEAAKKAPALTVDAEKLLHDLTRGPAIIRVEVIDPKNLFLRSPNG